MVAFIIIGIILYIGFGIYGTTISDEDYIKQRQAVAKYKADKQAQKETR
jgi:hypothetical protein